MVRVMLIIINIKVIFVGQGWVYKSRSRRWNKTVTEVFTVTEVEVWDILI